jgi:hypothetical protein
LSNRIDLILFLPACLGLHNQWTGIGVGTVAAVGSVGGHGAGRVGGYGLRHGGGLTCIGGIAIKSKNMLGRGDISEGKSGSKVGEAGVMLVL